MKDYSVARRRMVHEQLIDGDITDDSVVSAMRTVPRHLFVPRPLWHRAYQPCALPIGFGQTISQPFTVALMTTLLELQGHERILEVGTGSGYQGAILARLVKHVVSLERITPLAERAARTLADLGQNNIEVLAADGCDGVANSAPFDAIMITACAPGLPELLFDQLRDGGYLIVPIQLDTKQTLYRYKKRGTEIVIEQSIDCNFVPLLSGVSELEEREANA